jgi:hypothetical protein
MVSFHGHMVCFGYVSMPILAHAKAWEHLTTVVVVVQGPCFCLFSVMLPPRPVCSSDTEPVVSYSMRSKSLAS